jgi:SOS-response transcriptional repressor LexA
MVSLPLTMPEVKVLRYIRHYIARHECAPTLGEIAEESGIGRPEHIAAHMTALQRKGCIRWTPGRHRSIALAAADPGPRQLLWNLSALSEIARQQEPCAVLCETC